MSISTVLLAYKEEENLRILIPQIIEQLDSIGEEYEILIIDSAEPQDNTGELCEKLGVGYINQEEPFFAGALKTGIKYAKYEKFLILDADCSHDPIAIPAINSCFDAKGADLVIGSRYVKGGISNDSKSSRIMSGILNGMFRWALKVNARDISTDYRMYRTSDLKAVDLRCERYDVLQEVILKIKMLHNGKIHIEEVPIEFQKRAFGQSKRQLIVFILHYLRTIINLTSQRILFEQKGLDSQAASLRAELITNVVLYAIIGCAGAVVDYLVFCLSNVITGLPLLSNVIGALFGFFFTFYFNTFFNYISRGHYVKKFISYALICLVGTFVSTGMMQVGMEYLNVYVLKVFCMAVAAVVQFILNRVITYRIFDDKE